MKRLALGRIIAAALVSMTVSLPAAAAEKVIYLLPAPAILPAFAPWMLAQHLGYYKAEGYEVEFKRARGGVDVAKQVGLGNAQIGGALGDTPIIVRAVGVPVRSVALLGGGSLVVLVARGDRGIKSPKDLKGKKISVLSYQDTTYFALLGTLAAVGLKREDVSALAVGPRNVPGFAISGQVDACVCVPDWEIYVTRALKGKVVAMPTLQYFPSMAQAIVASDDMIKKNPKLVKGIVRATLKGVKFIMDNPDKAAAEYVKAVPLHKGKEKLMAAIFRNFTERTYKGQEKLGMMDPARLEKLQQFYLKQGIIRKTTPTGDLYTNDFID